MKEHRDPNCVTWQQLYLRIRTQSTPYLEITLLDTTYAKRMKESKKKEERKRINKLQLKRM
jgi:hypothetical protein